MEAHIALLNAHAHIQIHTYRHMKNGSAHFTTRCTHTYTTHTYRHIKMEAHISLLNAHAHIQIHTYRHMKNGSAHFTTKCTHTYTTHTYRYMTNGSARVTTQCTRTYTKTYIQTYEKWKRTFDYSMHTHIYKYIHTDI